MTTAVLNPFNLTKANDFSDEQIQEFWVDISEGGGLLGMLKPTSPMPMLVLGGKGSGKTHLMRYCSFELQKLRAKGRNFLDSIESERFIGIYVRCEGLNANRFALKGQPSDVWNDAFQYYMELFLSELLLRHIEELLAGNEFNDEESAFVAEVSGLFDLRDFEPPKTIANLIAIFVRFRAEVDVEVNNCAIKRNLAITIRASRSKLIFGVPVLARKYFQKLSKIVFLYLIDELENFSIDQQRYVFTLLRERRDPASFKIGARLYGIKTYLTFSGDEEIKEGAEYEQLPLDELLRGTEQRYKDFAKRLISSRIANLVLGRREAIDNVLNDLEGMFQKHPDDKFAVAETAFIIRKYSGRERPYFERLDRDLAKTNIFRSPDISRILDNLRFPTIPLLEKMNTFLLYRAWSSGKDLLVESEAIKAACKRFADTGTLDSYGDIFSHFSGDLFAQLLRDTDREQEYLGIDSFIHMSMGLPRNLLICLKHIYHWAVFNGDKPFQTGLISIDAQQKGVKQAADWFFRDASTKGEDGRILQESIIRLAELFRTIRFSAKPVECSLCSFSTDSTKLTEDAKKFIVLAEKYSLLIGFGEGQKDKNSMRVDAKYQLNSMLAPRWDLPIYRRGVIPLEVDLANAIFDPSKAESFQKLLAARIAGMSPPFSSKKTNGKPKRLTKDHPQLGI